MPMVLTNIRRSQAILQRPRICYGRTGDEDNFYDEEHEHDHRLFDASGGLVNQLFY